MIKNAARLAKNFFTPTVFALPLRMMHERSKSKNCVNTSKKNSKASADYNFKAISLIKQTTRPRLDDELIGKIKKKI